MGVNIKGPSKDPYLQGIMDSMEKPKPFKVSDTVGTQYIDHLSGPSAKSVQGKGTVTIEKKSSKQPIGPPQETEEKIPVPPVPPHLLASVHVGGSMTINLGNFESAKVTVAVTLPCHKDQINDAYEFGSEWVSEKIEKASKDAKKGI